MALILPLIAHRPLWHAALRLLHRALGTSPFHRVLLSKLPLRIRVAVAGLSAAIALWINLRLRLVERALRHLRISRKLALGFGLLILVSLLSSAFVYQQARALNDIQAKNLMSDVISNDIDQLHLDADAARGAVRDYVIDGEAADYARARFYVARRAREAVTARRLIAAEASALLPEFDRYAAASAAYDAHVTTHFLELLTHSRRAEVVEALRDHHDAPYWHEASRHFDHLKIKVRAWSNFWDVKIADAISDMILIVVIAAGAAASLGALFAWLFSSAIARPMRAMTHAMDRLARGDHHADIPAQDQSDEIGEMARAVQVFKTAAIEKLALEAQASALARSIEAERAASEAARIAKAQEQATVVSYLAAGLEQLAAGDLLQQFDTPFPSEYERVRLDFNSAVERLRGALQQVSTTTSELEMSSEQLGISADDLNVRTRSQAANLEEIAATLNGVTQAVEYTARGVGQARTTFSEARREAEQSRAVIERAIAAMQVIETAATDIGGFADAIDAIARQTNLLSLNATIEAERAGISGRGFAVVAAEVRALANMSAARSREIRALTNLSSEQIHRGSALVGDMSQSLSQIVAKVIAMDEIANGITISTQRQSASLGEINGRLGEIETVTRQTAAMVGDTTGLVHSLSERSRNLAGLVSRFSV